MNQKSIEIQRAISEIKNIYPPDNLIENYKDFKSHRDFLHYYQYNSNVFCSLIDITYNLWESEERISRQSLIQVTKRYISQTKERKNIPLKTRRQIFELFNKIVILEKIALCNKSIKKLKQYINSILIGITLSEKQLHYLCGFTNKSNIVLNRVLRYPNKSTTVSNWARINFQKDLCRNRRAEMTSWLIDEDQTFEIDKETLIFDFEYLNAKEQKNIDEFRDDLESYKIVESELRKIFKVKDHPFLIDNENEIKSRFLDEPKFESIRRFYGVPISFEEGFNNNKPDLKLLSERFYSDIDTIYIISMTWSIAYSRISISDKINLLRKYYSDEFYPTFFSIGKRLKSIEYFEWLKKLI